MSMILEGIRWAAGKSGPHECDEMD